jgi:CrcB protein
MQNHLALGLNKFPFATLLVNVIGSFLAGILYFFIIKNFNEFSSNLKNFLLIGFLGGYTTFSAFSLDLFRLIQANQNFQALIYAILSVLISLIAIFLGFYLMKFCC